MREALQQMQGPIHHIPFDLGSSLLSEVGNSELEISVHSAL